MDDLARYAKKMGGWEKMARLLFLKLIPYLEQERESNRQARILALGSIFAGDGKRRGRPQVHDFAWIADLLIKLENSRDAKPHESAIYHWQQVVRRLYPGLRPQDEDAKITTLRNIVSAHRTLLKRHASIFPEGNITPDSGDFSESDTAG